MAANTRRKSDSILIQSYKAAYGGFGVAIFFSLFINLLAFVGPMYMLQIYDRVITSRSEMTLVWLTALAGFLLVVYALLEKCRSAVLVRVGAGFSENARQKLFNAVAKGTLIKPNGGFGGAMRDLDSIREFLTGNGFISFFDAPWVPIFVGACFLLHPAYGWVALGGAVIIFTLALLNELATRDPLSKASTKSAQANHYLGASLRNAEVIHAMGMLPGIRRRWEDKHNEVLGLQADASDRAGYLLAGTKFIRAFLQVVILGVGAYLTIQQESTPGAMIAASILMGRALAPVEAAVGSWKSFISARTGHSRIEELLALIPEAADHIRLPTPEGRLSVEQVFAGPPGSQGDVLKAITFQVEPGQVVAVIGPSAAGKSSLARVLVGVWRPMRGSVRLDGAELSHWDPEQLGEHIGYLPQDVELFAGTVAENIARFGTIDEEAVIAAAQLAGVHQMIQGLPEGYNSQIGDSGGYLSGGQRQRVGLARALYKTPSLIILDEPNSNLDAEGEAALLNTIRMLRDARKTVVLITHKTNMLSAVDKVLVLMGGVVTSFGDRDEVLSKLMKPAPGPRVAAVS